MKTTINRPPDDMTMQELATRCRLYRKFGDTAEAEQIEPEQNEKPLHIQAVEILGHIHNCDYGLAESKAMILRDQLQKGDWTLGARTETELADGGFVRMYCDGAIDNVHISNIALSAEQNKFMYDRSVERVDTDDRATLLEILQIVNRLNGSDARKDVRAIKSMKSVDGLITKWGAQPNEDTTSPEERTCAFCGHDTPSMICGGSWFCDMRCANDNANKFEIADISDANHIEYLEQVIEDRDKTINRMERKLGNNKAHIHNIWGIVHQKDITLVQQSNTIDDLESQLVEKQAIIDNITTLRVNEVETLYNLKAELSARKEDSKVFMKVVEIVKRDDCCPTIINQLADLLVDYTEAPEAGAE